MALMGIRDFGQWKYYAIERFRGILNLTVLNADKTRSALPAWAKERIKTAFNVQDAEEVREAGAASGSITPKP
jgi:hypothetical protein